MLNTFFLPLSHDASIYSLQLCKDKVELKDVCQMKKVMPCAAEIYISTQDSSDDQYKE
jgi:hypothetical protein